MTDAELIERAKACVAHRWCAGEMSTQRFDDWMAFFIKADRAMFDRAVQQVIDEEHHLLKGEAA